MLGKPVISGIQNNMGGVSGMGDIIFFEIIDILNERWNTFLWICY